MKQAEAILYSVSPYSCSKFHQIEKLPKEMHDAYERRTWRERCNYNKDGYVFIPPMAFKKSISTVASYLGETIKGEGKARWTKHFMAGILVIQGLVLDVKKDDVEGEWYYVSANGTPGGSTRVLKCFPVIHEWQGSVTYEILDDKITEDVFRRHLIEAGKFIGVGRFRPEKGGFFGRYALKELIWVE